MKIVALDLSTNTGVAVLNNGKVVSFETVRRKIEHYVHEIRTYEDYPPEYPFNFLDAANDLAEKLMAIVATHKPDLVVIEEVNKARARFSQKALEYIHFAVITKLRADGIKPKFLTQRCWRDKVGAYASKEDKYLNAKIGREKRKTGKKQAKIDGKVVGRRTTKHFSVREANRIFGLELILKDNDAADALCLAAAAEMIYGATTRQSPAIMAGSSED